MKKINLFLFFVISLFSTSSIFSQEWMGRASSAKNNFNEIQHAFYDYWKDKKVVKGQGYKQFKRWEWFWEQRVFKDGSFPSPYVTRDEWNKYVLSHSGTSYRQTSPNGSWQFQGPSTTPGGYNGLGRINCIAFHPTNENIFWVGTPAGGLWKTANGGQTWTTNTDNLPVLGVSDIAIDPVNPNIMYLATGDGDRGALSALTGGAYGDTKSIGVLKSTNGGQTWSATGLNWSITSAKLIRRLIINPLNPRILIAAASDGIWRTTDGGEKWTQVQDGEYFMDLEFKPGNPDYVYATTFSYYGNAKIFRSLNAGLSWYSVITMPEVMRIDLAVSPHWPDVVDALCAGTNGGLEGLWYSVNSGNSFGKYLTGTCSNNMLGYRADRSGCGGQGSYDLAYATNPQNSNILFLGGINTYSTSNGGQTWSLKTFWNEGEENPGVATVHADKHFIAFHPLLYNTIFECNDGGLYKSTDGGNKWQDLSNGLGISQLYRIGVSQTVSNNVLIGMQDNGSRGLTNGQWFERTGGDGMECIIDYSNPSIQYASYVNGELFRTNDAWQNNVVTISQNLPADDGSNSTGKQEGAWVTPYVIDPLNPAILYAGYKKVYKTTNRGNSWTAISPKLTSDNLRSLCVAPSNPNTIYAATFDTLFMTNNAGGSWRPVFFRPNTSPTSRITYITVDPINPQKVYVSLSGYDEGNKVFMSPNGGTNWINYSFSLPNVPVNCIVYQKGTYEGLYIGTDVGVFYTNASMPDWIPYQNGLPNVVVTELEISYNDNRIWAGTYGRGLWSSDLYSIVTGVSDQMDEKSISVFPNPTTGKFSVFMKGEKATAVTVYNSLGMKVYDNHSITNSNLNIDLNQSGSGVFVVQLAFKNKKQVTKKIIVKR